jgi:sarcosine oxidase subunit beta
MMQIFKTGDFFPRYEPRDAYDIVIIGAGVHGLSTAYYLSKLGITNIAVLDRGYVGGGGSARTTAILRANYFTAEAIPFFRESLKLYEDLSGELDLNLLFDQTGRLDLGHAESAVFGLQTRADFNRLLGVDSRMIGPAEISELVPAMDMRVGKLFPVLAALYHPPAGVIRHDAVVWGYARGAGHSGVHIRPFTEVTGLIRSGDTITGVQTPDGPISAGLVVNATAGWASTIAAMANLDLPLVTHPLQVGVTEPVKPFLDVSVSSANLHAYVYQTDRGEVVIGGGVDPYQTYSMRSGFDAIRHLSASVLKMFPDLRDLNVLRQWSGLCDMTPDYAPIMGRVSGLDGFLLTCGWGTWGFKAAPMAGSMMAELIATGVTPEPIRPFALSRFWEGRLLNERASAPAAAVH